MDAPPSTYQPVPTYKDRRRGLIGFGIVEIVIGCVVALFLPLSFFGQALSAKATGAPPNYQVIVTTALLYGLLALLFIWLGVGSIQSRRWARALSLILSWTWLLTGIATVIVCIALMPR